MNPMVSWCLTTRNKRVKGQSLAEYGLILALIAVVCIAALTTIGSNLSGAFTNLAAQIWMGMGG